MSGLIEVVDRRGYQGCKKPDLVFKPGIREFAHVLQLMRTALRAPAATFCEPGRHRSR